jgi:hypothetical protein
VIGFDAAPRFAELVERTFGQRDFAPPGVILELDRFEYAWRKRESRFTSSVVFVAANAANVSKVEASYAAAAPNAAQRYIAIITGVKVCGVNVVAADRYSLTINGASAATPAPGFLLDMRSLRLTGATATTQLQFSIANNQPSVNGDIIDEISADVTGKDLFFSVLPVLVQQVIAGTLLPRLQVTTNAVNKALRVVMWGYERLARADEFDDTKL